MNLRMSIASGRLAKAARPALALALLALLPGPAGADVALSNNLAESSGGTEAASGGDLLAAAFTTEGSAYSLTSVTLALQYSTLSASAVVSLYSDGGYQPGSSLETLAGPTSAPVSTGLFDYTFSGPGLTLNPNTTYWVVLQAPGGEVDWSYSSVYQDPAGSLGPGYLGYSAAYFLDDTSWFLDDTYALQMNVTVSASSVPEPNPLALAGIVAVLAVLRRPVRIATPAV